MTLENIIGRMTREEIALTCLCINRYGEGTHPVADEKTLPYFVKDYVMECIQKGLDSIIFTEEGMRILSKAREEFNNG